MPDVKNSKGPAAATASAPAGRGLGTPAWACLGVALLASLALSVETLSGQALPGCGEQSACERLTGSVWGRVPGLGWPLAHLGSAFFLGLLLALLRKGGPLRGFLGVLVFLGALVSLGLVATMVVLGSLCPWCLAVHLGNLGFVALALRSGPENTKGAAGGALARFAGAFALASLLLGTLEWGARGRAERDLEASLARMEGGGSQRALAGRFALGPERSPVRVVVFTDYQCPDCRSLEGQVEEIARRFPQVSVSTKHFPFCSDCNRRLEERNSNPHPNACRAALAAEAAGELGGVDGFWRMHRWLFERGGKFTAQELGAALPQLGLDPEAFERAQGGEKARAAVASDVEEGIALGLYVTPMIFVNGEELEGWNAERALVRAVETLLAQDLPALEVGADRAQTGLEKLVEEWRSARRVALPTTPPNRWLFGKSPEAGEDAVEVLLWGDFLDAPTRELDARIRAVAEQDPRIRYAFRFFPLDATCNEAAPTRYAGACDAALAAAESLFAGPAARRALHERLMTAGAGAPGGQVSPRAREALALDIRDARRARLHAVPLCFVDGRPVKRWRLEGQPVIETILAEALED